MDGRVEQIRKMQENLYWRVVCCLPHAEVHANIAYLLERLDEALRLLERARTRIVKTGYDTPDIDAFLAHKGESNGHTTGS